MYKKLSFSGGGVKSLSFIGVSKVLEKYSLLNKIKHFYGTSGGSIVSTLLYIGYKPKDLEEVILKFDLIHFTDINADNLLDFFNSYGIDSGEKFEKILKTLVEYGLNKFHNYKSNQPNFIDLYNLIGKDLNINAVCLNTREVEIFNHINTPNLSIVKAIRMSCSLPLLVKPLIYNNKYYVDGGLIENLIIDSENYDDNDLLAFYISDNNNFLEINSLSDYLLSIISVVIRKLNKKNYSYKKSFPINLKGYHSLDFNIDNIRKKQLINQGYNEAIEIFKKYKLNLQQKKVFIIGGKYKNNYGLLVNFSGEKSAKIKIENKYAEENIVTIRKKNIIIE